MYIHFRASLVAQRVKNPPAIQETQIQSLGQEDPQRREWLPTTVFHGQRSLSGLPVHHQLPELTQTHVHRVSDAIQPCHPLSSPSPLVFNLSQHQGLFK